VNSVKSIVKKVKPSSHSFREDRRSHYHSPSKHNKKDLKFREEFEEDVRRLVTHSEQKATALKALKNKLFDSGVDTTADDSDRGHKRNTPQRSMSTYTKSGQKQISNLRRAVTNGKDLKKRAQEEGFDGRRKFNLAATANSGSILDKYIATARETAWVVGKTEAKTPRTQSITENDSYTESDWTEKEESSSSEAPSEPSEHGWSSNNSESASLDSQSMKPDTSDFESETSQSEIEIERVSMRSRKSKKSIKSNSSKHSKKKLKPEKTITPISPQPDPEPVKKAPMSLRDALQAQQNRLGLGGGQNLNPEQNELKKTFSQNSIRTKSIDKLSTTSSQNILPAANRRGPKTPPRRHIPSSKTNDNFSDEEEHSQLCQDLGDLVLEKQSLTLSRDQSLEEAILESDNESDLFAEEQEHKKQLESPNCECSTNSEEEILDTGSGISHEEYREEVKCHPLLETIIEESDEEEHVNSPVLTKSVISKESACRTKSVESLDTGLYKSPRFHSRTGNFSAKEPQESPVTKTKNDNVNKARERLNMQLGVGNGLEKKPMIVLPSNEPVEVTKKKKKSLKKVKNEDPEVTQNIQIIEVEETTTTVRRKKKKNSVKKEKKTKSLTVDADENIKIIPAEPVTLKEVEEILKTNKKDKKKLDRQEKKKKKLEELIGVDAANQVLEDEQKPQANTLPRTNKKKIIKKVVRRSKKETRVDDGRFMSTTGGSPTIKVEEKPEENRRESNESSSGVSTMNSLETPERLNSEEKQPESALDSINAILNKQTSVKKAKKKNSLKKQKA